MNDVLTRLEEIHKGLLSGAITIPMASNIMEEEMKPTLQHYVQKCMEESEMTEEDKQIIFMIVQITQYIYEYSGYETGLTDPEYYIIYETYINLGNEEVISPDLPFNTTKTAEHTYKSLRGTLTKIYYLSNDETRKNPTRKYLTEWIASREHDYLDKTGNNIDLSNEDVYVFPKWDGVSCIFEFNPDGSLKKALTRGNVLTNVAQDITKSFPMVKGEETPNGYGLKTEIMMKEEDLEYFNRKYDTDYKNTRSVVASILNSDTLDERNELLFIQKLRRSTIENGEETLQVLDPFVFTQPFIRCKLKDINKISKFAESVRYVNGLRCDGAVMYFINEDLRKILGREDDKNKYEVAYKFTEEAKLTKLKDVTFQVGLFGNIAPVAIVKPVKMKGNEINRISLGSVSRLESLDLRKGDKVKVLYDIIPYLVFDADCEHGDGKKIKIPSTCPACGEELEKNADGLYAKCINPECSCRKKGKILNYVEKIGIKNISYATIDALYDNGIVKTIDDLYILPAKMNKIIELDGFGKLKYDAMYDSIESHRVITDYQMLGAIGIDSISTETCKKLMSRYRLDELMDIAHRGDIDTLCEIPGIKDKKAKKIINGLVEHEKLLGKLMKYVSVIRPRSSSFKVAFTKVRDEELEKEILRRGGEVTETVTKDTTYLVVPNLHTESTKVDKAKKYGVKLVPIDDFLMELDRRG